MKSKSGLVSFMVLTVLFFLLSGSVVSSFTVVHTDATGQAVQQTFVLGEMIVVRLGGSLVLATITKIGGSAVTVRFKGGGTASFNKKKIHKKPPTV